MRTRIMIVAPWSHVPGIEFDPKTMLTDGDAELTTESSRSSYGQPVLSYRGTIYGPGDLPEVELVAFHDTPPEAIAAARGAGWTVREYQQ